MTPAVLSIGTRPGLHPISGCEAGTPFCITIDGETMEQGTVTIRDRDTMEQTCLSQDEIVNWLQERIHG